MIHIYVTVLRMLLGRSWNTERRLRVLLAMAVRRALAVGRGDLVALARARHNSCHVLYAVDP
jgi:hypothetical protein